MNSQESIMVKCCVVANCSHHYRSDEAISLHLFSKDRYLRKKWSSFVGLTRADWTKPSDYSLVCSAHFKSDCYVDRGYNTHYPVWNYVQEDPYTWVCAIDIAAYTRFSDIHPRSAIKKLEHSRTLAELDFKDSLNNISGIARVADCSTDTSLQFQHDQDTSEGNQPPHDPRPVNQPSHDAETEEQKTSLSIKCQATVFMCDREVQCNPLITEESDLSGCTEMDSESVDPSFKPTNEQSDDSDTSLESEANQPTVTPPQERKFLVFESMLLSLFAWLVQTPPWHASKSSLAHLCKCSSYVGHVDTSGCGMSGMSLQGIFYYQQQYYVLVH